MKQYKLFPINTEFDSISTIVAACDSGEVKIAIGKIAYNNLGRCRRIWDSILCFSKEEAESIKFVWEYAHDKFFTECRSSYVNIQNWDFLQNEYGVEFLGDPDVYENFFNGIYRGPNNNVVYINNMNSINYGKQFVNSPKSLGEYCSDFGGYGSQVLEPFDFQKQDLKTLGFLAGGSIYGDDRKYTENWKMSRYVANIYLEKYLKKFSLIGKTVIHAEGNFPGRPGCRSWNTGLGETKETLITGVESLKEFAYLGFRCLKIY